MIKVTNDIQSFLEQEEGELIIYGAGNAGYWIGWFMNRCGIEYSCYIDRNPGTRQLNYNDHRIYPVTLLEDISDRHLRLIISPAAYKEILADLLWMDHTFGLDALCLIPQFRELDTELHKEVYDINHLLGYFRRKLYKKDTPTIIANTCISGRLYDVFNMPIISPTINTGIDYGDYVKFCLNFKHYMSMDVELIGWERDFGNPGTTMEVMAGRLDDIKILFAHTSGDEEEIADHWNMMRHRINWDNLIFLMAAYRGTSPAASIDNIMEFEKLPYKHYFIDMYTNLNICNSTDSMHINDDILQNRVSAIENYFDIVGWMNR